VPDVPYPERTPPPPVPPPGAPGTAGGQAWSAGTSPGPSTPPGPSVPPGPDTTGTGSPDPGRPGGEAIPEAPGLDDRDRTLDPRVVQVWRLLTTLGMLVPLTAVSIIGLLALGRAGAAVPVGAVVLLAVLVGWYPGARWRRWRWRLTPLALELRYGVLVHTEESVPYFRIQQIDIAQGPLDRLLELATLQVTTASASGSVALPGIPAEQAPEVRAELLVRAAQAVAEHPGEVRDAV
jgi:uncharacterized protein